MASTNTTSSAKTHVSLRLPTYILESIDAHAEKENISRTEAFVFYLQTGLDIADVKANEPSKDESMFQAIQDELAEIKMMLQAQQPDGYTPTATPSSETIKEDSAAEAEELNEEDFTDSDAVMEETPDEESSSFSALDDAETFTEIKPLDDLSDFTTSDAPYDEGSTDLSEGESEAAPLEEEDEESQSDDDALSHKKLEKAIAKAAKEIDSIEKIWLYGPAAENKEITDPSIDLCVKTEDDEKLKSKHLDAFVTAVEEKTGKAVNVVLRHEGNKDLKQALKNKVELYKK